MEVFDKFEVEFFYTTKNLSGAELDQLAIAQWRTVFQKKDDEYPLPAQVVAVVHCFIMLMFRYDKDFGIAFRR